MARVGAARRGVGLALALAALLVSGFAPSPSVPVDRRLNIVLILSDDQSPDSLPHDPPVMPYLQGRMADPTDHWTTFANAFLNTPLCCPSRATILTGLYSHHTGVQTNYDGGRLDESSTIATWLHDAGYRTGLIGKYLNGYPFGSAPYVPPGWDRWLVKEQGSQGSLYYDYVLVDQGYPVFHGTGAQDYSTDVYSAAAVDFIESAPADQPFFLEVAPSGPHRPWTPAPRDAGTAASMPIARPPSLNETDVSDKPAWVRALPPLTPEQLALVEAQHRRAFETLRSIDDLVAAVVGALSRRGVLDRTVIFYLTDNGLSFGEHRWVGKTCPYEECVRTPFAVRAPWSPGARVDPHLVSNVDLAPTIADLAGVGPPTPVDGRSLVPLLRGPPPADWPTGVLLEYAGDSHVPAWSGLRTDRFVYVEYATGERELYDLTGVLGSADPFELDNRAAELAYADVVARLAERLNALRAG